MMLKDIKRTLYFTSTHVYMNCEISACAPFPTHLTVPTAWLSLMSGPCILTLPWKNVDTAYTHHQFALIRSLLIHQASSTEPRCSLSLQSLIHRVSSINQSSIDGNSSTDLRIDI